MVDQLFKIEIFFIGVSLLSLTSIYFILLAMAIFLRSKKSDLGISGLYNKLNNLFLIVVLLMVSGSIIYYLTINSLAFPMFIFFLVFLIALFVRLLDIDIFGPPVEKIDLKTNLKTVSKKFEPKNITKTYVYVLILLLFMEIGFYLVFLH